MEREKIKTATTLFWKKKEKKTDFLFSIMDDDVGTTAFRSVYSLSLIDWLDNEYIHEYTGSTMNTATFFCCWWLVYQQMMVAKKLFLFLFPFHYYTAVKKRQGDQQTNMKKKHNSGERMRGKIINTQVVINIFLCFEMMMYIR